MSVVQPNEYTLKGGNITFTYVKNNFLGQPFVTFSDGGPVRDFFGSGVRVLETGIGTLVTITTRMSIDTGGTDFSVLLPVIELQDASKTQNFSTEGIVTNFKGPDSFPATGVRETYDFYPMNGVARVVRFPGLSVTVAKAS